MAHFATKQAFEKITNIPMRKDLIPSVVYGSPEIAWIGKREQDLKDEDYKKSIILLSALGKSWCDRETDGIIKGTTNDGKREVKFIQVPSRYKSNEKTEVAEEKHEIESAQEDTSGIKDPINKEAGVTFDQNRFKDLFDVRDAIMHGDDPDLQNEFISQLNALFDLCFVQQVSPNLIRCIQVFYNENKNELENVRKSGTMIDGKEMNTLVGEPSAR